MSTYIVMEKTASMPASCWGRYINVGVVELEPGFQGEPKMLAERAKGVRRIVQTWRKCHAGLGIRDAAARARYEARALAAKLNGEPEPKSPNLGPKNLTNGEVVANWLARNHNYGRSSNGNLFFRDNTIYSYGEHFPIARFDGDGEIVLLTTQRLKRDANSESRGYRWDGDGQQPGSGSNPQWDARHSSASVTTANHRSMVMVRLKQSPSGRPFFTVPNVTAHTKAEHEANHADYVNRYKTLLGKAKRATKHRALYFEEAQTLAKEGREYSRLYAVGSQGLHEPRSIFSKAQAER